jgi:hypothetical protein
MFAQLDILAEEEGRKETQLWMGAGMPDLTLNSPYLYLRSFNPHSHICVHFLG